MSEQLCNYCMKYTGSIKFVDLFYCFKCWEDKAPLDVLHIEDRSYN